MQMIDIQTGDIYQMDEHTDIEVRFYDINRDAFLKAHVLKVNQKILSNIVNAKKKISNSLLSLNWSDMASFAHYIRTMSVQYFQAKSCIIWLSHMIRKLA